MYVFSDGVIIIITIFLLLLPLAFWMYVFTTFFYYGVTRLQFIVWLWVGVVSTFPLVYNEGFFLGEIFFKMFNALWSQDFLLFWVCITMIMSLFLVVCFLGGYFFQKSREDFLRYFYISLLSLIIIVCIMSFCMLLSQYLWTILYPDRSVNYGWIIFSSLGGIISYYAVISILEESGKYIGALGFSGKWEYFRVLQKYLCLTACIALGFAFFENILYTYSLYQRAWISGALIQIAFFRGIFSVVLHLLSSIVFALGFWYIFSKCKNWKKFLSFTLLGMVFHIIFDLSLNFGFIFLLAFYIFAMYILLSYITSSAGWEWFPESL